MIHPCYINFYYMWPRHGPLSGLEAKRLDSGKSTLIACRPFIIKQGGLHLIFIIFIFIFITRVEVHEDMIKKLKDIS